MKLTINEIAKMANVAKSTVSKALNGQKGVSEENRKRILSLVQEVNYQPNASARALAQNKAGSIGLVVPHDTIFSLSGEFWSSLIPAVASAANKKGYTLTVIAAENEGENSSQNLEMMLRRRSVDGFIIGAEQLDTQNVISIMSSEIPFVFIGQNQSFKHYSIDAENTEGSFKVTQQLISRGYKNIGCIAGPADYIYTIERIKGFKQAMQNANLNDSIIMNTKYLKEETVVDVHNFVEENPNLDALFLAAGGEFVLNILEVLRLAGADARKFGIGVFDDSRIFDFLNWSIITARQPLEEMGKAATDMLFDIIDGNPPENPLKKLDVEIILR